MFVWRKPWQDLHQVCLPHPTLRSQDMSESSGNNAIALAHLLHMGNVQTQNTLPTRNTHAHTHRRWLFRHMIPASLNIERSTAHKTTTRQLADSDKTH